MEQLSISNFRKVKGDWNLNLAPITFFTGTNNSGKSSVLKSLMLLSDYVSSENHLELSFKGNSHQKHKIDCYSNAVNWDNSKEVNFNMHFTYTNNGYSVKIAFDPFAIGHTINNIQKGKLIFLQCRRILDGAEFKLEHTGQGEYQLYVENSLMEEITEEKLNKRDESLDVALKLTNKKLFEIQSKLLALPENDLKSISLKQELAKLNANKREILRKLNNIKNEAKGDLVFMPSFNSSDFDPSNSSIERIIRRVLIPYFRENEKKIGKSNKKTDVVRLFHLGDELMSAISFRVNHLSPHRNSQTRLYTNSDNSCDIYQLIELHEKAPINKTSKAAKFIINWMSKFDIGDNYRIRSVEGVASIIEINENGKWINLVDKGFGAGQIFTILLKIGLCINESRQRLRLSKKRERAQIVLIEEPEANLHPALQSLITEMLYEAYYENGISFIVETHSEYILRRSQLLVKEIFAKNENAQNPLMVYYFDKDTGPSQMRYNRDGSFRDEFGEGFLDESSKLIFDLY